MITIIFATQNNFEKFQKIINNFNKQSSNIFEVIVVDFSDEQTFQKKKEFIYNLSDNRIKFFMIDNKSTFNDIKNFGEAINFGIKNSFGSIITWIYDYLVIPENFISKINSYSKNNHDITYFSEVELNNLLENNKTINYFIIKKKIIQNNKFFLNYQIDSHHNYDFFSRLILSNIKFDTNCVSNEIIFNPKFNYDEEFKILSSLFLILKNLDDKPIIINLHNNFILVNDNQFFNIFNIFIEDCKFYFKNNIVNIYIKYLYTLLSIIKFKKNEIFLIYNQPQLIQIVRKIDMEFNISDIFFVINSTKHFKYNYDIHNIHNKEVYKTNILIENNNYNIIIDSSIFYNNNKMKDIINKNNKEIYYFDNNFFQKINFIISLNKVCKLNNLSSRKLLFFLYSYFFDNNNLNIFIDNLIKNNINDFFNILFYNKYFIKNINKKLIDKFNISLLKNHISNFNIFQFYLNFFINITKKNNQQDIIIDDFNQNQIHIDKNIFDNQIYNLNIDNLNLSGISSNTILNSNLDNNKINTFENNLDAIPENDSLSDNNNQILIKKTHSNNVNLSFIVLCDENSEFITNFLNSLLKIFNNYNKKFDNDQKDFISAEIIIIDKLDKNYSKIIKNIIGDTSNIKIVSVPYDFNFGRSVNSSILNCLGEYVIFINKYFHFDEQIDIFSNLFNLIKNDDSLGLLAPVNNFYFDFKESDNINTFHNYVMKINNYVNENNNFENVLMENKNIPNVCFIIKKTTILKIGLFFSSSKKINKNNNYIYNYEIIDIIQKINILKLKTAYVKDLIIQIPNNNYILYDNKYIRKIWKKSFDHIKFYKLENHTKYIQENFVKKYISQNNNNIDEYSRYNFIDNFENAIAIDHKLYKFVNSIDVSNDLINYHIYSVGVFNGYIFSTKQILNIYPKIHFFQKNNDIFVNFSKSTNNIFIDAKTFVKHFLYEKSFDWYMNLFKLVSNKIVSSDNSVNNLILAFIGNESVGNNLINKIINYKKIDQFSVVFIFIDNNLLKKFYNTIKNNFDSFAIYKTKQFGNDIIPTLIVYNHLNKIYTLNNIIKLHTKSDIIWFNNLTDYLLSKTFNVLSKLLTMDCNCVGNPIFKVFEQKINKIFLDKYKHEMDKEYFIAGSIFFANKIIFDKIIDFIKNNSFKSFFLNNYYDNNQVNRFNSPVHFIERLFGRIIIA